MVDSILSNVKNTKELEQELKELINKKRETNLELAKIIRENRIFQ